VCVRTEEMTKKGEMHEWLKRVSVFVCLSLWMFFRFLWTAFMLTPHLLKLVTVEELWVNLLYQMNLFI
jgi:hypothetical protein